VNTKLSDLFACQTSYTCRSIQPAIPIRSWRPWLSV